MKALKLLPLIALLGSGLASAQPAKDVRKGVPAPARIVTSKVGNKDLVSLYNSFDVLGEKLVGSPSGRLRIIGTWGESAGLDCDCVLTRVSVAMNYDGEDLQLYSLGQLLDPKVDSIVTEGTHPVAYISYGQGSDVRHARIELLPKTLRITDARGR
jgi:hypothetical protein